MCNFSHASYTLYSDSSCTHDVLNSTDRVGTCSTTEDGHSSSMSVCESSSVFSQSFYVGSPSCSNSTFPIPSGFKSNPWIGDSNTCTFHSNSTANAMYVKLLTCNSSHLSYTACLNSPDCTGGMCFNTTDRVGTCIITDDGISSYMSVCESFSSSTSPAQTQAMSSAPSQTQTASNTTSRTSTSSSSVLEPFVLLQFLLVYITLLF
jgi:hypothetical protein